VTTSSRVTHWIGAILAPIAFSGCATIMDGSTQQVSFQSTPDGATVTLGGQAIGKTPITTTLKKRGAQPLIFSKDGYKTISLRMDTRLDGWFWGNILFGGFIGSTTDGLSGAVNEYSPGQYLVSLQPEGSGPLEGSISRQARDKAREFIIIGYRNIVKDLQARKGEYLTSLLEILNVPTADQSVAISKLDSLAKVYTNIPEFAERVLDLFMKIQSPPPAKEPPPQVPRGSTVGEQLGNLQHGDVVRIKLKDSTSVEGSVIEYHSSILWLMTSTGKIWKSTQDIVAVELLPQ